MRRTPAGRASAVPAVICWLAAALWMTGCDGGSSGAGSPQPQATVGSAVVGYPSGWTVLGPADAPKGWDWAAQPSAGADATAQLAVDGDLSHAPSSDLAVASLLAAAQVGALPHFAVQSRSRADVDGAADGVQVRFTYQAGGHPVDGLWVVARSKDSRVIAVQLTGTAPLSDALVDEVRGGIRMTPQGAA